MSRLHRQTLCAFALVLQSASVAAERGPTVFICGHSFLTMSFKGLPGMAASGKHPIVAVGQQILPSSTILDHWNLPAAENKARAALETGEVDVLILSPHFQVPDPGLESFTRLMLNKNRKLRVLVQISWPANDGVFDRAFRNSERDAATLEKLHDLRTHFETTWAAPLQAQVNALNQSLGREVVRLVPAASACFTLRERIAAGTTPGLTRQSELFFDSLGHPRPVLAALSAYCHYAVLTQQSPVGLPVPPELETYERAHDLNELLQEIAWSVVREQK